MFSTAGKRRSRSPHEGLGVGVGLGEGGEKGKKRVSLENFKLLESSVLCVLLLPQVKLSSGEIREMSRDKIISRSNIYLYVTRSGKRYHLGENTLSRYGQK